MAAAIRLSVNPNRRADAQANPLLCAAKEGDLAAVEALLAQGINVNATNQNETTALMSASAHGQLAVVQLLLNRGAAVNQVRSDGFTALLFAVFFGHVDVLRELIKHGADVQAKSREGASAQMWAAARGFREIVNLLNSVSQIAPAFAMTGLKDSHAGEMSSISVMDTQQTAGRSASSSYFDKQTSEQTPAERVPDAVRSPRFKTQTGTELYASGLPADPPQTQRESVVNHKTKPPTVIIGSARNSDGMDFGEGIRRLTPGEPTPRAEAQLEERLKNAAPYKPFSALEERLSGKWRLAAAAVVVFGVFGAGLGFLAWKGKIPLAATLNQIRSRDDQPAAQQSQVPNRKAEPVKVAKPAETTVQSEAPQLTQSTDEPLIVPAPPRNPKVRPKRKVLRVEQTRGENPDETTDASRAAPITFVSKQPVPETTKPNPSPPPAQSPSPLSGNSTRKKVIQWP